MAWKRWRGKKSDPRPYSPRLSALFERFTALHNAGANADLDEAERFRADTLDLVPEGDESPGSVAILLGFAADVDLRCGDAATAEARLRRALAMADDASDAESGRAVAFLAGQLAMFVNDRSGDAATLPLMEIAYDRARRRGLEPVFVAMQLVTLALAYHGAGRYVSAEAAGREAIKLCSAAPADPRAVPVELAARRQLSIMYSMTGAWARACDELRVAAELAERAGDRAEAGAVLIELAQLGHARELPDAAEARTRARHAVLTSALAADDAAVELLRRLSAWSDLVSSEEPVVLLGRALQLARRRGAEARTVSDLLVRLGNALAEQRRYREADETFQEAELLLRPSPGLATSRDRLSTSRRADVLVARAKLARQADRPEAAVPLAERAVRLLSPDDEADDLGDKDALQELALAYAAAGAHAEGVAALERAVVVEDASAAQALVQGDDRERIRFAQILRYTLHVAMSAANRSPAWHDPAFGLLLARKGRAAAAAAGGSAERPRAELLTTVAAAVPVGAALVDLVRFRDLLADGEPARYAAFVLVGGRDAPELVDLGPAQVIESAIGTGPTGRAGSRRVRVDQTASAAGSPVRVRRLVVDPWLDLVHDCDRLYLSTDGELTRVCFAALPVDGGGHLLDRFTLTHLAAGRDVHDDDAANRTATAGTTTHSAPVVIGDPDFGIADRTPPWRSTRCPAPVARRERSRRLSAYDRSSARRRPATSC